MIIIQMKIIRSSEIRNEQTEKQYVRGVRFRVGGPNFFIIIFLFENPSCVWITRGLNDNPILKLDKIHAPP